MSRFKIKVIADYSVYIYFKYPEYFDNYIDAIKYSEEFVNKNL